jgi:4-diphosphocytidyl-2-C-methyl-D-erythritol kinase
VVVRAPAKVNLTLAVLGRRADGFHEVDTVLLALELADRLEARRRDAPGVGLRVEGPAAAGVPTDATNLVVRAATALLAEAGDGAGLEFVLAKHVPAGGGLGGGSSDAAAAILAGATLLGLDPDGPGPRGLLASLGSDCAFFLEARATGLARCRGRGERVEPWSGAPFPWPLVVVAPGFGCATARVYQAHEARLRAPAELAAEDFARLTRAELTRRLENDLLPAALRSHAELGAFRNWLEELLPGRFHLSGSGSSCFALAEDEAEAETLGLRLTRAPEARRFGLRGPWVTRAAGRGVVREV